MNIRLLGLIFLLTLLSGCNALNNKPTEQEEQEEITDVSTGLQEIGEIETLAEEAYTNKNWTLAEKTYIKLIKKLPNESKSWFRLGNIYARTNRHGAAINAYRTSLNLEPGNIKVWNNLGIVQLREATNSFLLMQQHLKKDDPLSQRTNDVVEAMTQLLEQGFSVSSSSSTSDSDPETDPAPTSEPLLKMDNNAP